MAVAAATLDGANASSTASAKIFPRFANIFYFYVGDEISSRACVKISYGVGADLFSTIHPGVRHKTFFHNGDREG